MAWLALHVFVDAGGAKPCFVKTAGFLRHFSTFIPHIKSLIKKKSDILGRQKKKSCDMNIDPIFKNSTDLEPQGNSGYERSLQPKKKNFFFFRTKSKKSRVQFRGKGPIENPSVNFQKSVHHFPTVQHYSTYSLA